MSSPKKTLNADRIVAFTAILISICALVVSFYEVRIMRTQQEASVWPYVILGQNYNSEGFTIRSMNKGIGPAKIESLILKVDGEPLDSLGQFFTELAGPEHKFNYNNYSVHGINQTVLEPGYDKHLLKLPWTPDTYKLIDQLGRVEIEVIYSSILGECWWMTFEESPEPCDCPKDKNKKDQFNF
ncbi:MAG: hypothetical protein HEP71_24305 [Roseivirga sp.]|nr:hypothetical protein [Roseivirga sp.]